MVKKQKTTPWHKGQCFFLISAFENAIGEFISQSQYVCGRTRVECFRDIEPPVSNFNAYG